MVQAVFFCHVLGIAITNLTQMWYLPWNSGIQPCSQAFWNFYLHFGMPADLSLYKATQNSTLASVENLVARLLSFAVLINNTSFEIAKFLLFTQWSTELSDFPVSALLLQRCIAFGRESHHSTCQHISPTCSLTLLPNHWVIPLSVSPWLDLTKRLNTLFLSEFTTKEV